jgi:FdhD protein
MSEVRILRVRNGSRSEAFDDVATEEPLEIRLLQAAGGYHSLAVTMRTPGNDFELVAGFLFSEGLVAGRDEIGGLSYCIDKDIDEEQRFNIVNAALPKFNGSIEHLERHFTISSSCGVCGKAHLDALEARGVAALASTMTVASEIVLQLPQRLLEAQRIFAKTGGLHATALFSPEGTLRALREDVGRHNAMDKLVGWALLEEHMPLGDCIALVSGRTSFEIVQKAAVAGIPILCAVSAPSSLAVEMARRFNITLVGFLRDGRYNIYSAPERISS